MATPQGRYLLDWEQNEFDRAVADVFGYNALQIGLPEHDFLRASRISYRFASAPQGTGAQLLAEPYALPIGSASLDLVLLPHVLEFSRHPHQVLREVERVLVPDGRVIIAGFNPFSLFGARRMLSRSKDVMPWDGHYFSFMRLKDWLTLLGFETQSGGFGCYAPPACSEKWIRRWGFVEKAGQRWWPVCGGVFLLQGVKRVHGMTLITPRWRPRLAGRKGLAPVARRGRGAIGNAHKTKNES